MHKICMKYDPIKRSSVSFFCFSPVEIQDGGDDFENIWSLVVVGHDVADEEVLDKTFVHFSRVVVCMVAQLTLRLRKKLLAQFDLLKKRDRLFRLRLFYLALKISH